MPEENAARKEPVTSGRELESTLFGTALVYRLEMQETATLCPHCGWTGPESDLEGAGDQRRCPVCDQEM